MALTRPKGTMLDCFVTSYAALRSQPFGGMAFLYGENIYGEFVADSSDLSGTLVTDTVTTTTVNSSTDTATKTSHGLDTGDAGIVTAAVDGLATETIYRVIKVDADNFKLASNWVNCKAGTAFDLTGTTNFTFKKLRDPAQGCYVIPTGNALDGSAGAWRRLHDARHVHAGWFGAIHDWNQTDDDAGATENSQAFQDATNYVAPIEYSGNHSLGGLAGFGGVVDLAGGTAMFRYQFRQKDGVKYRGLGGYTTVLRLHQSFDAGTHAIIAGNSLQAAAFDCGFEGLSVYCPEVDASANVALIYSNNLQHPPGFRDCYFTGAHRTCLWLETGYGGASEILVERCEFNGSGAANGYNDAPIVYLNYGDGTIVKFHDAVFGGPAAGAGGANQIGVACYGGTLEVRRVHFEEIATGIQLEASVTDLMTVDTVTGGTNVTSVVSITSSSTTSARHVLKRIKKNGATNSYKDNRSGGATVTDDVVAEVVL